jgi:hypothetical protein
MVGVVSDSFFPSSSTAAPAGRLARNSAPPPVG